LLEKEKKGSAVASRKEILTNSFSLDPAGGAGCPTETEKNAVRGRGEHAHRARLKSSRKKRERLMRREKKVGLMPETLTVRIRKRNALL